MHVVSVDRRTSVTQESVEVSSRIISAEILLRMSKPIWFRLFHFELAQSKQNLANRSKSYQKNLKATSSRQLRHKKIFFVVDSEMFQVKKHNYRLETKERLQVHKRYRPVRMALIYLAGNGIQGKLFNIELGS